MKHGARYVSPSPSIFAKNRRKIVELTMERLRSIDSLRYKFSVIISVEARDEEGSRNEGAIAVFFSTSYRWLDVASNNAETIASIAGVTARLSELW